MKMAASYRAMLFAKEKHRLQCRKYTGEPYAVHLAEVAGISSTVAPSYGDDMPEIMSAVAWLHDCIEDQGVKFSELKGLFGEIIATGALLLSDLETGNRAERKHVSRERLAGAPDWVQTIKCADFISNTASIVTYDPNFAAVYLQEKQLALDVMTQAHPYLHELALRQTREGLLNLSTRPPAEPSADHKPERVPAAWLCRRNDWPPGMRQPFTAKPPWADEAQPLYF